MKKRIGERQELTEWFKQKIDPDTTSRTDCLQWREMALERLVSLGYSKAHARVTMGRAWSAAGFPSIKEWKVVPHDKVEATTIDDAVGRLLIKDVLDNVYDEPVAVRRSENFVSVLDALNAEVARLKL